MKENFNAVSNKKIRSFFYRDSFYRLFKWIYVVIFLLILCITFAIYVYYTKPTREYYVITQFGIVQQLIPEKDL